MADDSGREYPGTTRKAETVASSKDNGDDATHDLLLSDGTTVPSSGGIPTHYGVAGGPVLRVLSVTERQPD